MSKAPSPQQPVITFAQECDRGIVREENQDAVKHVRIALGDLLIVADGIGGYRGGAVASRIVVESFVTHMASLPANYAADQAIREASALANANIQAEARAPNSSYHRMGSTVVLVLLQQNAGGVSACIGHVGDSRAYLVRGGQLIRLTNDHSAVQALLNRNLITPEEALHHPDASVLTRSLGHQPEVEIDVDIVPLASGDSLLLCSDGLWGYVAEKEIEAVALNPELGLQSAATALKNLALAAGGHDNIGIVMARLERNQSQPTPAESVPARASARGKQPRRSGFLELLALLLLGVGGLGALAYFAYQNHWLDKLLAHRATHALSVVEKFTFAIVGDTGDAGSEPSASAWRRMEIPEEKLESCRKLAEGHEKLLIFTNKEALVKQFEADHPSLFKAGDGPDIQGMNDEVANQCGRFNLIVIVPERVPQFQPKTDAPSKPAVQPKPHTPPGTEEPPAPVVPDQAQPKPPTIPPPGPDQSLKTNR
jgi:protein phosphatase